MIKNAPELVVDKSVRINAPREHVFKLLSDPKEMKRWEPITSFEARVGGRFQFEKDEWIAVGEVIEFDPPRAIAYTWDWKNSPLGSRTVVRYELETDGDATVVRLTHTGFLDAERAKNHAGGWQHYNDRLKIVAEGGDPGPDVMED